MAPITTILRFFISFFQFLTTPQLLPSYLLSHHQPLLSMGFSLLDVHFLL
ncbi:hypothetical protein MANES_07G100504v8 [Manihot esculenta]|uniref:Uncharacterized protein n=1 Tax=Manihot esculenta TaxID=3983 RepID=A0ACB7HGR9_MANES|nr:hypothetical protein MANES_07G100504v8 [Manihot esculenta]